MHLTATLSHHRRATPQSASLPGSRPARGNARSGSSARTARASPAFGVFVAQLFRECGDGPASRLFAEAAGRSASAEAWTPVILTGRRVSFARELLRVVAGDGDGEADATAADLVAEARSLIERPDPLDAQAVAELVSEIARGAAGANGKRAASPD